jgi:endonuclease/exonuclease/phosphatase family metal-dependent hydrolase
MRIVSLNAWGGALFTELAAWLPTVNAGVVCLQEVTRTAHASGWTQFADGERRLPQRADLYDDVRTLLPHHQGIFLSSDAGPVTDETGVQRTQDFGLATFVADEIPLIGVASTFVHGEFVHHQTWPTGDRPRTALATRLADPASGRTVTVVQLHGLRDPAGKQDTPARRAQAERIASLVESARAAGDLVVATGDFNLLPDSETFDILKQVGLIDLVGTADTRTSHYPKQPRNASYLLVSDPAAVRRLEIMADPEVSDHKALILEI